MLNVAISNDGEDWKPNSAADCDGNLEGDPVWQPDDGMVAVALQFDGIDDYVSTDFVLNPSDGAFSVVAWIKGDAPGQIVGCITTVGAVLQFRFSPT